MNYLIHILLFTGSFLTMEAVAWASHKYIMHGPLWVWHKSHHQRHHHILERNDLFALVFSLPSISLIVTGYEIQNLSWLKFIGFGILAYGVFYFLFHDVIVHKRIKIRFHPKSNYLKRIIFAHYVHHKTHTKQGAEAFGFLYAPKKYARESTNM